MSDSYLLITCFMLMALPVGLCGGLALTAYLLEKDSVALLIGSSGFLLLSFAGFVLFSLTSLAYLKLTMGLALVLGSAAVTFIMTHWVCKFLESDGEESERPKHARPETPYHQDMGGAEKKRTDRVKPVMVNGRLWLNPPVAAPKKEGQQVESKANAGQASPSPALVDRHALPLHQRQTRRGPRPM